jgi:toxin CcdB
MRQFDVCRLRHSKNRAQKTYVVLLQRELLESLDTRIVAPLEPIGKVKSVSKLNPVVAFEGTNYAIMTDRIAAVLTKSLETTDHSLIHHHDEIIRALDFLFTG